MSKIDLGKIVAVAVAAGASQVAADVGNKVENKDVPTIVKATAEAAKPEIKEAQAQLDHATNQEVFYMSRQWWVSMLGIASSVLAIFGIAFPAEMQEEVVKIAMAASGAVTGIVLLYNRYFATKPIGQ